MKTILVGINAKYIHPSIALYQLKTNTTYDVEIMEFTIKESLDKIYNTIMDHHPQVIGFSCYLWNITHITDISQLIKTNHPEITIVLGGPEVSYDQNFFLQTTLADFIISGEGEVAFHKLLLALHGEITLDEVPSLSYLKDNRYYHNAIELPNIKQLKLAPLSATDYHKRILYLESSRGCPFNCSYCLSSVEKRVRFFPLVDVINIIKEAINKQIPTVKFLDRTFNINKKYFLSILKLIEEENIATTFQFEIVADLLDSEIMAYLSTMKTQFLRFEVGIQSINDQVNEAVNRKQNIKLLKENILEIRRKTNIELHLDLIVGLPFETKNSLISSFNEVITWQPTELQLGFLKFLRGTRMLELVDQFGYLYDNNPPYEIIENTNFSKEDLTEIKKVEYILNKLYNSKWFPKTINYLFTSVKIASVYHFFLAFYQYLESISFPFTSYQRDTLYYSLAQFIDSYLPGETINIRFYIIQDYLEKSKTRPKKWWNQAYASILKHEIFPLIEYHIQPFTKEDFFRNSVVIKNDSLVYICFYQNFKATSFLIPLH